MVESKGLYLYSCLSEEKDRAAPRGLKMVTLKEDNQRRIEGRPIHNPDTKEIELTCHLPAKETKEEGIHLKRIQTGLNKRHGIKRYEKNIERIGRLKGWLTVMR